MRRIVVLALMSVIGSAANAADWPEDLPALRGGFSESPGRRNWEGWYVGGQFGYSAAQLDMGNANKSLTDYILRNSVLQEPVGQWSLLESKNATGTGFGGFVGRNWQWEDAVVGLEISYANLSNVRGSSSGSMGREINSGDSTPPPNTTYLYNVGLSGSATTEIKDIMTLRARAGWDAGAFMPYAFAGVALGRINVNRSATVNVNRREIYTDPVTGATSTAGPYSISYSPNTRVEGGEDSIAGGYSFGVGAEFNLVGGLFARAEWEYARFVKVKDVGTSMNSARVGVGYRF